MILDNSKHKMIIAALVCSAALTSCDKRGSETKNAPAKAEAAAPKTEAVAAPEANIASQKSLEDAIVKTIKAFQNKDTSTLNKLMLKDFGIALVDMPGMYWRLSIYDKIPFDDEEGTTLKYIFTPFGYGDFITDYTVRFEELPAFDCGSEKWNKPQGRIYCDATSTGLTRSGLAEMENRMFEEINWPAKDIKRWEKIEEKSHTIMAISKEGGVFTFHLTFWQNEWFLTMIESFEACGA